MNTLSVINLSQNILANSIIVIMNLFFCVMFVWQSIITDTNVKCKWTRFTHICINVNVSLDLDNLNISIGLSFNFKDGWCCWFDYCRSVICIVSIQCVAQWWDINVLFTFSINSRCFYPISNNLSVIVWHYKKSIQLSLNLSFRYFYWSLLIPQTLTCIF